MKMKKGLKTILFVATTIVVAFSIDFAICPGLIKPAAPSANKGTNGLWLRYKWYFGEHTAPETDKMIDRLKNNQIKYAYFHVRFIKKDGSLRYKYKENAIKLNKLIHEKIPDTKSIAWIYVQSPYFTEGVNIAKPEIRKKMIEEARWLVEECNFDGIQWDYELFPRNEPNFNTLLDETRAQLGKEVFISIATPMWYPDPLLGWDRKNFSEASKHCDQIAVMCYDSFYYYPRAYTWLVEQQAINVTRAVKDASSNCSVMLGIPVYDAGTVGHMTHSENIRTALTGVRNGLSNPKAYPEVFDGVSPFAEYTMDEDEWGQYRKWWLDK